MSTTYPMRRKQIPSCDSMEQSSTLRIIADDIYDHPGALAGKQSLMVAEKDVVEKFKYQESGSRNGSKYYEETVKIGASFLHGNDFEVGTGHVHILKRKHHWYRCQKQEQRVALLILQNRV